MILADDLPPEKQSLPDRLAAQPEHYRRVYHKGLHSVFSLTDSKDPTLTLAEVPKLPPGARRIPRSELRARANVKPGWARWAVDDNPNSYWTGSRAQQRGHYFELDLQRPRQVVALEIENPEHVMDVPMSFELSVALGASDWQTVVREPKLRVFREQVYTPKTFVYRVVLPLPTRADRIRITIAQALPGHYFTVHEARVYETAR